MVNELKEAVAILKRVYQVAVIPNSDGNDHLKIQDCISKLDNHINGLPADPEPTPPTAAPAEPSNGYAADGTPPETTTENPETAA